MSIFDPRRVGVVDASGPNRLIRGNFPLNATGTHYAYAALAEALAPQLGLTSTHLVDLAILDHTGERRMLEPRGGAGRLTRVIAIERGRRAWRLPWRCRGGMAR